MSSVIEGIGSGFQELDALLQRLDKAVAQASESLVTQHQYCRDVCAALPKELDLASARLSGLADRQTQLSVELDTTRRALVDEVATFSTQSCAGLRTAIEANNRSRLSADSLSQAACQSKVDLAARVAHLKVASEAVAAGAQAVQAVFLEQELLAQARFHSYEAQQTECSGRVVLASRDSEATLLELSRALQVDAVDTIPQAFSVLVSLLDGKMPLAMGELFHPLQIAVHQQFADLQDGALARALLFADRTSAVYQGLTVYERQSLPNLVGGAMGQRVFPVVRGVVDTVLRIRKCTFRAGEIAEEFAHFSPLIKIVIDYFLQVLGGSLPASGGDSTSAGATPASNRQATAVAFDMPREPARDGPLEPVLASKRTGPPETWTLEITAPVGKQDSLAAAEMISRFGYQNVDPAAALFHPPPEEQGQWHQNADLTWVHEPDAASARSTGHSLESVATVGSSQVGAPAHGSSSPAVGAEASRQGTPPVEGRNLSADAASARSTGHSLESVATVGSSQVGAPAPGLGSPAVGAGASHLAAQADANVTGATGPAESGNQGRGSSAEPAGSSYPTPGLTQADSGSGDSGGAAANTLGGISDTTRENYEKMHGGQNTPQSTLDHLRQQTIDQTSHHQSHATPTPTQATAGASTSGGSSGSGDSGGAAAHTLGGISDTTRENYERMHGGQNTPQSTLDHLRQQTIDHATHHQSQATPASSQGAAGASASGGSSGSADAGGATAHTLGGIADTTRENYQKMHGGQNTPQSTLDHMRQQTIDHASHHESHATPASSQGAAGASASGGSSGSADSGGAAAHTLGGIADTTRENYQKMHGGQNTPQSTLDHMRQQTIDHASHHESHATPAPTQVTAGASASGGSSAPAGLAAPTLGGLADTTRENYEKMQGGQNTPLSTLEAMRQRTVDNASRHHPTAAKDSQERKET